MTNSTPKSNKVERQGSPNSYGKQKSQRSSNYVKTVTYFAQSHSTPNNNSSGSNTISSVASGSVGGRNSRSSTGRQSCSPPCSGARNIPRSSPNRYDSPRGSPTNCFYAGAKFSEPPSPASLPKPPSHWTGLMANCQMAAFPGGSQMPQHLKMMINIQA